jgi:hypothetical protein
MDNLNIKWHLNDNEILSNKNDNLVLVINKIQLNNYGRYKCRAIIEICVEEKTIEINRQPDTPRNLSQIENLNAIQWFKWR